MARTTIEFNYKGVDYTLCLTIDAVKKLERNGFSFGKMEDHIVTAPCDLFCATFNAYHKDTPRKLREEIYRSLAESSTNDDETSDELSEILFNMVSEVIEEMNPKGNVAWKVTKS